MVKKKIPNLTKNVANFPNSADTVTIPKSMGKTLMAGYLQENEDNRYILRISAFVLFIIS